MPVEAILFAAGILVVVVVVVVVISWVRNKPLRESDARSRRAAALRPGIIPLLQRSPAGLTSNEVAGAIGAPLEDVQSALGRMVMEGLAHQVAGEMEPRFVFGRPPPPAPRAAAPRNDAQQPRPPEPDPQGLPDHWKDVRLDVLRKNAQNLDNVHDILHPIYRCKGCRRETTSVVMLSGALMADKGQFRSALDALGRSPESLGIDRKSQCQCGRATKLHHTVVCRTNPTRNNDMHVTVDAHAGGRTPRVSVLTLDGQYVHLPNDAFQQMFAS